MTEQEYEAEQVVAATALIKSMGPGRRLGELIVSLLSDTTARDGGKPFSEELVSSTLEDLWKSGELTPPASATPLLAPVDAGSAAEAARFVVATARRLEESTGVALSDSLGQLLWRHREADALEPADLHAIAEDLSWIDKPGVSHTAIDMAAATFRQLTAEDSGRMRWRAWQRVVHLIQRNPLLNTRVVRTECARFFHARANLESRRAPEQAGLSVGLPGFLCLLVQMAESVAVHPFMVFLATGCHAETLASLANLPVDDA